MDKKDAESDSDILEDSNSMMRRMMARMTDQFNHAKTELQNSRKARAKKHMQACFERARGKEGEGPAYYDLFVRVRGITPHIHRSLRIKSTMSLHDLADRVLVVAFCYARGEHSYQFNLPTCAYPGRLRPPFDEDIAFQDLEAGTIDAVCHRETRRGGKCPVPAQGFAVGDVLRAVGDTLHWTYDFGDDLCHTITLAAVHASPPPTDKPHPVLLLGGGQAGIPENPGSIFGYAEVLDVINR